MIGYAINIVHKIIFRIKIIIFAQNAIIHVKVVLVPKLLIAFHVEIQPLDI
jgi:hypothetical protein